MQHHFRFISRGIWMVIVCLALSGSASADVKADRTAVAQRIGEEIESHLFKKVYVADFPDAVSGRIDKGCYFASVFSTSLTEQELSFVVVNRIEGQRLLTKAEILAADLQKPESPAKVGAATGADVLVMGTFQQNVSSIVLEISVREAVSGKEIFHTKYLEQATDEFEALFPAARDTTGTIYLFAGLDGIGRPKCITCPPPAAATTAGHKGADQLLSAVFMADGKFDEARIVRSADPTLDQAALEALKNWKAEPAKDASGTPVPVRRPISASPSQSGSATLNRPGVNGVTAPSCIYCPQPEYSEKARADKLQGTVLLDITVTAEGRASNIVVIKAPRDDLGQQAVAAIQGWKFKPSTDSMGNPVAVRLSISVTFHLYK